MANETETMVAFRQAFGRRPTRDEVNYYSNMAMPSGGTSQIVPTIKSALGGMSEAQQYKTTGKASTFVNQPTGQTVNLGQGTPSTLGQLQQTAAPAYTTTGTPTTYTYTTQPTAPTQYVVNAPTSTQYTTPAPAGYTVSTIPIGATPSAGTATSVNPFLAPQDSRPALPTLAPDDKAGPFGIPSFRSYYEKANKALDAYYQRVLAEEYGDVDRAVARLREDYDRGVRVTMEDYTTNLAYAQESANAARMEEAATAKKENRALTGNLLSRGVSEGGLAEQQQGELKSAQDLRREAIDRALRKSETDLGLTKERGLEETTKTQKRGTEDTASNWQKFQTAKAMEREEKALGLAEANYGREFSAVSTQKSFELAQEGLKLQREAMGK